jgi:putative cell wall-binding protein
MSKTSPGALKRVGAGLLAGALAVLGIALAAPAGAVTDVTTDRVAGQTRFGTAGAACAKAFPTGTGTVLIATARNFPDALAASALAGANKACVLLSEKTDAPKETLDAITIAKATKAIIVGGTDVITDAVKAQLEAKGLTVTRIAGNNRYGTAAAILNALTPGSVGGAATCIVASGESSADALAAGPGAYRGDGTNPFPILLVTKDSVPSETAAALAKCKNVIVVGGTAVISDATKTQIGTLTGDTSVDRVAGTDRFKTSVEIAKYLISTLKTFGSPTTVLLANGFGSNPSEGFSADALVSGPLGGVLSAPILLVQLNDLGQDVKDFLDLYSTTIKTILGMGGTAVIATSVLDAADAAAQTTGNDTGTNQTATARPELVSAAVVKTVSSSSGTFADPAGTTVAFTFDEPVTGAAPVPGNFHLYRYSAPGTSIDGTSATVSTTDNKTVNVLFGALTTTDNNTSTGTAGVTVATVDLGAVTGNGAISNAPDTNPEGSAPLTSNGTATVTAGATSAPDLLSVGRFGLPTVSSTNRLVDFTFDQAAYNQSSTTGFHLVTTDNVVVDCTANPDPASTSTTAPSGGSAPGGNGTTVITVTCPAPASGSFSGQPLSSTSVARGYVDRGAVGTATLATGGGTVNPIEASNTPHTGTSGPDLASVNFQPGTGTATVDTAVFTFDDSVLNTGLTASNFLVYLTNGSQVAGTGTVTRNTANTAQVSVTYTLGTLTNAVGASVLEGAVASSSGTNPPNRVDEVAAAATSTTVAPGSTAGPDLTNVTIVKTNNAFGQVSAVSVLYTFDSNITSTTAVSKFFLHLADGSRMVCGTAVLTTASSSSIPANTAVCSTSVAGYTYVTGQAGTHTGSASLDEIASGVLGSVDNGAVQDASANPNVEGAKVAAGGGTPSA